MDKKVSKMVKTNNVNAVFYTLENDRDKWSNTSTINHAHLLIQGRNLTRDDVAKSLNINPKAVIDVEKIKGVKKITNYITKSMWHKDSHHNIFY